MLRLYCRYCHSKLSEHKFRLLVRCFALDLTASDTATLSGLASKHGRHLRPVRECMVQGCEHNVFIERGEAELGNVGLAFS